MKSVKRQRLEKAGWKVGSADAFLGLTPDETAYIEMKLALGESLRTHRLKKRLSQVELAELIASSQSRVAKMEAADASVSIDLMVRSLLAMGVTRKEVANSLAARK